MTFPAYPTYRESGIEWIGPVPAGWSVKRLRFLSQVQTGIAKGKDVQGIETIRVPYLRVANVQDGFIDIDDVSEIEIAASDLGRYLLRPGDVLMNEGGDFDKLGRGQVWNGAIDPCIHQNHVFAVRPHGIEPEWLALVTSADCGRFFFMTRAKQSTNLASISSTNLLELPVPCPPPAERRAILRFLDRETGKIDALVAEQERLIALLKEKRQAVISQAVTKGLDASAPMKDSGVAWLGQVPAHWEVVPIKSLSPVQRGASPRPIDDARYFDEDGEYAWVRIADVSASDGRLEETPQRLSALGSSLSVRIEPGDLFVSIAGSVGKPCISAIKACIHDGFVYFPRLSIDCVFLFRIFEAGLCYAGLGKMGTQLNLNTDTIGTIKIGLPPTHEIAAILKTIDSRTAELDTLTTEAQRAITLLRERRAALISAAVTGKIDVRGLAAAAEKDIAA